MESIQRLLPSLGLTRRGAAFYLEGRRVDAAGAAPICAVTGGGLGRSSGSSGSSGDGAGEDIDDAPGCCGDAERRRTTRSRR